MESVQDYEDWLARLGKVNALMDQTIERMKEGVRQGMVPPKITMSRVPAQIEKQIVATPEQSLFYKPFQQLPNHWSPVEQERIRSEAKSVIAEVVVPAYQRLYDYFTDHMCLHAQMRLVRHRYRTERHFTNIESDDLPQRI